VAQHHHEGHQRTLRPADIEVAEVPPVNLRLFARQTAQPQIGFGPRTRPVAGDQVAEVIGAAAIATLADHRMQAAGRQRREFLQRPQNERQIGVDLRRPLPAPAKAGGVGPARGRPACASTRCTTL
jgi:hypothetical protein